MIDPSLYESPERLQAILAQGAVFTGYSGKGKRIIVRKIFVFYEKDEDGDQYLYWSEPGKTRLLVSHIWIRDQHGNVAEFHSSCHGRHVHGDQSCDGC